MQVLDAGSGPGRNLIYLLRSGYDVSAVDVDPIAIAAVRRLYAELAPALPADRVRLEAIEALSFGDASMDVVISSAVLHIAKDDAQFEPMVAEMLAAPAPWPSSAGSHRRSVSNRACVLFAPAAHPADQLSATLSTRRSSSRTRELGARRSAEDDHRPDQRSMTTWVVAKTADSIAQTLHTPSARSIHGRTAEPAPDGVLGERRPEPPSPSAPRTDRSHRQCLRHRATAAAGQARTARDDIRWRAAQADSVLSLLVGVRSARPPGSQDRNLRIRARADSRAGHRLSHVRRRRCRRTADRAPGRRSIGTPGVPVATQNLARIVICDGRARHRERSGTFARTHGPRRRRSAVALALQDPLSNLFGGIFNSVSGQIRIGDYVKLESGVEGYILDFDWRSTRIGTLANNIVVVPNSKLAAAVVTNYSQPSSDINFAIELAVDYRSDLEQVERVTNEVAREVMRTVDGAVREFEPTMRFHTFAASSINFNVGLRGRAFTDQSLPARVRQATQGALQAGRHHRRFRSRRSLREPLPVSSRRMSGRVAGIDGSGGPPRQAAATSARRTETRSAPVSSPGRSTVDGNAGWFGVSVGTAEAEAGATRARGRLAGERAVEGARVKLQSGPIVAT